MTMGGSILFLLNDGENLVRLGSWAMSRLAPTTDQMGGKSSLASDQR